VLLRCRLSAFAPLWLAHVLLAMCVVATLTLQTTAPLEEMADLCLVNALGDAEFSLSMSKTAVLTIVAVAVLDKSLAELRLFEVGLLLQFSR
jgi:hypothetical protein